MNLFYDPIAAALYAHSKFAWPLVCVVRGFGDLALTMRVDSICVVCHGRLSHLQKPAPCPVAEGQRMRRPVGFNQLTAPRRRSANSAKPTCGRGNTGVVEQPCQNCRTLNSKEEYSLQ